MQPQGEVQERQQVVCRCRCFPRPGGSKPLADGKKCLSQTHGSLVERSLIRAAFALAITWGLRVATNSMINLKPGGEADPKNRMKEHRSYSTISLIMRYRVL